MPRSDGTGTVPFFKGYTWGWPGVAGTWTGPEAEASLAALADTGTRWVALAFAVEMATPRDLVVPWPQAGVVGAEEIAGAIRMARRRGLHVCLKPVVNCADGTWRAHIDFGEDRGAWRAWFASYARFLTETARLAADEGVELFCAGCEMNGAERQTVLYRDTLRQIRSVFPGWITYNCNHGRERRVAFWDEVDLPSVSAYYRVGARGGPFSGEEEPETLPAAYTHLRHGWEAVAACLEEISRRDMGKPLFFMEIGCRPVLGASARPYDWAYAGPWSEGEQETFYRSCLDVFWDQPWFCGYFWWDWPARLPPPRRQAVYCAYGLAAEQVLRAAYARPAPDRRPTRPTEGGAPDVGTGSGG